MNEDCYDMIFSVRVNHNMMKEIDRMANDSELNRSEFIRDLIESEIKRRLKNNEFKRIN